MRFVKPTIFPPWPRTDDQLRVSFFQRVILEMADELEGSLAYAFTVNLSYEIETDAMMAPGSFMKTIQERVARHMKERIGRRMDFWFGLEISKAKARPHLHGAIVALPDEVPVIKDAFEAASRRRGMKAEARAVRMTPITDADFWGYYATKGGARARRTFNCRSLSVTAELRRQAMQHYQDDRHAYQIVTNPEELELIA